MERNYIKPNFKDYHYHKVNSMFQTMQQIEKQKGETVKLSPVLKPTWQIYEYYCLFKVVDIFKQLGHTLTSGLKENIINYYFEDSIPEGSKFILENDENVIHVWYDHYHANSAKESKDRGEYFYTPLAKKKPDLKVDFFKKKEGSLWHNGTVILDAKFSKFKDIYNSSYNNSISEQLVSYFSFFYIGEGNYSGGRPCVVRMLCLYAGDHSNPVITEKEPITYLRLFPTMQEDERVAVGERELLQIFQNILN
ncbi:nuclease domain-containing protein [Anaerobacillus isosaccharinicus]|uniref:Nuclease domain-containing protein n=1 Tax=Anaerobacillus isosaccharinicus TaxID=1532552 RepID=A0A7S7L9C4_9BACI|nr:hypothetical protein [Anaerobacillus isosaccharinicus]